MEKKFKNTFGITGSKSLLRAFIEEAEEMGWRSDGPKKETEYSSVLFMGSNGKKEDLERNHFWYCHPCEIHKYYSLPEDWNKALQLAKEEVLPEYVKLVKNWSVDGEYMGEVFEVSTLDNLSKFQNHPSKEEFREQIQSWIESGYFTAVTKEEYIAQQNTPKFKVGDFYLFNNNELRYIHKIEDNCYYFYQEVPYTLEGCNSTLQVDKWVDDYKKTSDEEALELLKAHYAKQGIVEGVNVKYKVVNNYPIKSFGLVKNAGELRNTAETHCKYGNSQLAIFIGNGKYYTTPTAEEFKIVPKEVKVAGYVVEIRKSDSPQNNYKIAKIGCQWYTRDALVTIRNLIIHGIEGGGRTSAHFTMQGVGAVKVTVNELNEAIKLFDQ